MGAGRWPHWGIEISHKHIHLVTRDVFIQLFFVPPIEWAMHVNHTEGGLARELYFYVAVEPTSCGDQFGVGGEGGMDQEEGIRIVRVKREGYI